MPSCGELSFVTTLPAIENKVDAGMEEGKPSYVGFQRSVSDADGASFYWRVCPGDGETGVVSYVGAGGAASVSEQSCVNVADMECYDAKDCFCMSDSLGSECDPTRPTWKTTCRSDLARIQMPPGVGFKVFGSWDCSGGAMGIGKENFSSTSQTYETTTRDGTQSLSFYLLPGYKCAAGRVASSSAEAGSGATATGMSERKKVVLLFAGAVLAFLILLHVVAHKDPLSTKNLSNTEILAEVGLKKGGAPKGKAVHGSIRAILSGESVKRVH